MRVNDTSAFSFNTLKAPKSKMTMPLAPKAIHDEMNATTFDEFGRMQANLGVEASPPTPGAQNVTLYPYVNPATELIDGTNLPTADMKVTPIGDAKDGTQIWRFTHNGVDTHPIHFHLYDVQVLNRVTWDNIIIPPDENELGWKDTVRMSPLEDTIVALRPIVPTIPFEIPNSVRPLNPSMPLGSTAMFNNVDPQGNPTATITNKLVNFGWEYVIHCHILSHEEMDMMRPESLALPPLKADGLVASVVPHQEGKKTVNRIQLQWNDNSINETSFVVQRTGDGKTWTDVATSDSPLGVQNVHEVRAVVDPTSVVNPTRPVPYRYRVVALNAVGYGSEFPSMTVKSVSDELGVNAPGGADRSDGDRAVGPVRAPALAGQRDERGRLLDRAVGRRRGHVERDRLAWAALGYWCGVVLRRLRDGGHHLRVPGVGVQRRRVGHLGAGLGGGGGAGRAGDLVGDRGSGAGTTLERIQLAWGDVANETSYTIQWSATSDFSVVTGSVNRASNTTSFQTGNLAKSTTWYVRVRATNVVGSSDWSAVSTVPAAP